MAKFLKVQLVYSAIARTQRQKDTLRGLGLRHRNQVRVLKDTPAIRGMVQKVVHLVKWESTDKSVLPKVEKRTTYKIGGTAKKPTRKKTTPAKPSPEKAVKKQKKTTKKTTTKKSS